jgi:spore maturation protein CgeB
VQDVFDGWVGGLTELGVTTNAFGFDERIDFFTGAHLQLEEGGWVKAFPDEAGVHLANAMLRQECFDMWPDWLLVVSGFFVSPDTLDIVRSRGIKTAVLFTECPYEDDRQLERAEHCDLAIINDPTNLDRFAEVCDTYFAPHSYRPLVHRPGPARPDWVCDLGMVGTGFPSRVAFLEQVDWDQIAVRLGGLWKTLTDGSPLYPMLLRDPSECMDNTETAVLYRSARAGMNLYRKEASATSVGWAMGPREVEMAASGLFFLREPRGEGDDLFPFLPTFGSPAEFGDLLRWWLANDDARNKAAVCAAEAVEDRTFTNAARRFLQHIDT